MRVTYRGTVYTVTTEQGIADLLNYLGLPSPSPEFWQAVARG